MCSIMTQSLHVLLDACHGSAVTPRYYSTVAYILYAVLQQPLRSTTPSTFLKSTLTKTSFHILDKNTIKPTEVL